MRHVFIVNPNAGKKGSQDALRQAIRDAFPNGGCELLTTAAAGDAQRLTAEAVQTAEGTGEPVRIYACGGDGTLNEVVNAAAGHDLAAVTNIPVGSGNDFLRIFGAEGRRRFKDIAALRDGPQSALDVMDCNGRLGLDVICAGVDARTAADVERFRALPLVGGTGAYVFSLVNSVFSGITRPMRVDMGDYHYSGPTAVLCICNGRHYGGGFMPVGDALPDDGVLDVLHIGDVGFLWFLRNVSKYASGRYREIPDTVVEYHGDRVTYSSDEEMVTVIDGEVLRAREFTVKLSEKKLNFFRPEGVECIKPGK